VARTGGRLAGLLPCYLVITKDNPLYDLKTWAGQDRVDLYPLLLLGNRTGYYNSLLLDKNLPATQLDAVVSALVGAARGWAATTGARHMAFCHLDSPDWALLQWHYQRRAQDLAPRTWLSQIGMRLQLRPLPAVGDTVSSRHPVALSPAVRVGQVEAVRPYTTPVLATN
jgi:hypothetical protein